MNRSVFLLMCVFLSGCVHFENQKLDPAQTADSFQVRKLDDNGFVQFMKSISAEYRPDGIWNVSELTFAAFYFQPQLSAEKAKWESLTATIEQGKEWPNPMLSLSPMYNSSSASGISPWIFGLSLDVPVDLWGKRKIQTGQSEAMARAAWFELNQSVWNTRLQVRLGLLDVIAARERNMRLREQVKLLEENTIFLRQQHEIGSVQKAVVIQAEQQHLNAMQEYQTSEKEVSIAMSTLASVIGIPVSALEAVDLDDSVVDSRLPEISISELRKTALLSRSDILQSLAEFDAAQAQLQLEIKKQYPDISLGPGYEFDQGDNKWGLSLSLQLPVFNQNNAGIKVAMKKREEAAARFRSIQAKAISDIEQANILFESALKQLEVDKQLLSKSQELMVHMENLFSLGSVSKNELIQAQLAAQNAEMKELTSVHSANLAFYQLEYELQRSVDLKDWKLVFGNDENFTAKN